MNMEKASFEEKSGHILSEEFDEEKSFEDLRKEILDELKAAVAERNKDFEGKRELFGPLKDAESFVSQIEDENQLQQMLEDIRKKDPKLSVDMRFAELEQRWADYLLSTPKARHEKLDKELSRTLSTLKRELPSVPYEMHGPRALAIAVGILGQSNYEPYYTHPVVDVLGKVDLIAFDPKTLTYFAIQLKSTDDPDAMQEIITPGEFLDKQKDKDNFFKAGGNMQAFDKFVGAWQKRYEETFVPLVWKIPPITSDWYRENFDERRGLPNEELIDTINTAFEAMRLRQEEGDL